MKIGEAEDVVGGSRNYFSGYFDYSDVNKGLAATCLNQPETDLCATELWRWYQFNSADIIGTPRSDHKIREINKIIRRGIQF